MAELIELNPAKVKLVAGTSKAAQRLVLVNFVVLGLMAWVVFALNYDQLEDNWQWWGLAAIGLVFILVPFNAHNRGPRVNLAIDPGFLYLGLPYQYRRQCLRLPLKEIKAIKRCIISAKYRGVEVTVARQAVEPELINELDFMSTVEGDKVKLEVMAGMSGYNTIKDNLLAAGMDRRIVDLA